MEAIRFSETSVNTTSTRCHIPEDCFLYIIMFTSRIFENSEVWESADPIICSCARREYIRFISPQLSNNKRFAAYTLYNVRDSGPVLLVQECEYVTVSFYVLQCGLVWSGYNSAGWVGAVSFVGK
jgi:hypothetical protein